MIRLLLIRWLGLDNVFAELDFIQRQLDTQAYVIARMEQTQFTRECAEIMAEVYEAQGEVK